MNFSNNTRGLPFFAIILFAAFAAALALPGAAQADHEWECYWQPYFDIDPYCALEGPGSAFGTCHAANPGDRACEPGEAGFPYDRTCFASAGCGHDEPPEVSISAAPSSIMIGESSTLTWDTVGADSCTASGAWSGPKAGGGSQAVSPADTSVYTLTCDNAIGSGSDSATVTVTIPSYTLTVSKTGTGEGLVQSNPAGINCGPDCSEPYISGTDVILTAAPAAGSLFSEWTGCAPLGDPLKCALILTSNTTVTARFELPTVDAGPDQTINFGLPFINVILEGAVTNEDLPEPDTVEWNLIKGDATKVAIASPGSPVTTVRLEASGEYTFQFTAYYASVKGSDMTNVAVLNAKPSVSISPSSASVELGFLPITLNGAVSDDGLPNPPGALSFQWKKISGPGIVTFSDPAQAKTDVNLSLAGTYTVQLEVFDGEKTGSAQATIAYGAPARYSLIPCGLAIDNPETSWDETKPCELRHTLLLLRNVIDFTLWRLVPLAIAALAVATGAIFFFRLGGPEVMAKARAIWSQVGKGALILLFSWLFLNFLLGILGFDISIFGRWYDISA